MKLKLRLPLQSIAGHHFLIMLSPGTIKNMIQNKGENVS